MCLSERHVRLPPINAFTMYVSKIAFSLPRWSLNLAAAVSKKVEKFSLHAQRGDAHINKL